MCGLALGGPRPAGGCPGEAVGAHGAARSPSRARPSARRADGVRAPARRPRLGTRVGNPAGAGIAWATVTRHVYLEAVPPCPRGGRRRILAHIEEPDAMTAILEHLGLPTEAPPIARAAAQVTPRDHGPG